MGCISNSNALHWERQASVLGLGEIFDVRFLSHEVGLIKPDRELFEHVAATLGVAPPRIFFLDDNEMNVVAACATGIRASVARGVAEARSALLAAGILDAGHMGRASQATNISSILPNPM